MLKLFGILFLLLTAVGAVGAISGPQAARPSREHRATAEPGCKRTPRPIVVNLSWSKYPNILDHEDDAIHGRTADHRKWPAILTIHRRNAGERRARLLANIPTRHGYDRDEWPMAFGRSTTAADVRYVPSSENRSAGSVVGNALSAYCSGQRFRVVAVG